MRIISGEFGGRKITGPETDSVRPTGDRVRESLFSILGDLTDVIVVDAFAGTGALGLEALSRGAGFVYFFDLNTTLVAKNVAALRVEDRCKITRGSVAKRAIEQPPNLVFLDPPYDGELWADTWLSLKDVLAPEALCLCEHRSSFQFELPDGYELEESRRYGDTTISFVRFVPDA